MKEKREMYSLLGNTNGLQGEMLKIEKLCDFKDHPFKVVQDASLIELANSIKDKGILMPLIVRKRSLEDRYEIISGHRRKAASELIGLDEVPVIVVDFDDNDAIIAMVDSNIQRDNIKPSEKAYAYKMKLEAMKQQGRRTDLTSDQLGIKLNDLDKNFNLTGIVEGEDENGVWTILNSRKDNYANTILSKQIGESKTQIFRYIRLTNLIPKILEMVDEGVIAFTIGVELSYLNEEEQYELHAVMDMEICTPSLSQANKMKRLSQQGELDMDMICNILEEPKPNQRAMVKIKPNILNEYFPSDFSLEQKEEIIEKLIKSWYKQRCDRQEKNKKDKHHKVV